MTDTLSSDERAPELVDDVAAESGVSSRVRIPLNPWSGALTVLWILLAVIALILFTVATTAGSSVVFGYTNTSYDPQAVTPLEIAGGIVSAVAFLTLVIQLGAHAVIWAITNRK